MLKTRIITAAILIPFVLAAIFFLSPLGFQIATAVLALLIALEWARLIGLRTRFAQIAYALFNLPLIGLLNHLLDSNLLATAIFLDLGVMWWLAAFMAMMLFMKGNQTIWQSKIARMLMGLFILLPFWVAINLIRSVPEGSAYILILCLLVWGADTGAYFAGKLWGKHKLAEKVSPKKTLEGVYGALTLTIIIALIAGWYLNLSVLILIFFVLLALVTVLFSILGDLIESMVKRQHGVKDSGNILPGHGGLLDRLDSLFAAAPVFAIGLIAFGLTG